MHAITYLMLYMIHLIVTMIVVDCGEMNIIMGEIRWTIDGDRMLM